MTAGEGVAAAGRGAGSEAARAAGARTSPVAPPVALLVLVPLLVWSPLLPPVASLVPPELVMVMLGVLLLPVLEPRPTT